MKSLALSYVWWPGIDRKIADITKTCSGCQKTQHQPHIAPPHTWERPISLWQSVHIDYIGPFLNRIFLVEVDAYSKWFKVFLIMRMTHQ